MSGANPHRDVESWSDYEDRDGTDLAALPEAVRTIVEECRALSKDVSRSEELAEDGQVLPYPCRLYESVEGEDELLQLQWMRVDVRGAQNMHALRISKESILLLAVLPWCCKAKHPSVTAPNIAQHTTTAPKSTLLTPVRYVFRST